MYSVNPFIYLTLLLCVSTLLLTGEVSFADRYTFGSSHSQQLIAQRHGHRWEGGRWHFYGDNYYPYYYNYSYPYNYYNNYYYPRSYNYYSYPYSYYYNYGYPGGFYFNYSYPRGINPYYNYPYNVYYYYY